MQFPGARSVAIAASAVSADEQPGRLSVVPFPVQTPPPPDALGSELGCVMGHSDVHHGSISCDVISAVGNGLSFTQMREVVHRYLIGFSLGQPSPPPVLKGPHEFLLLRIYRNHRVPSPPKSLDPAVQVAKLGIAVRMLGAFTGLHISLQGVPHFLQTTAHRDAADRVSGPSQLLGDRPSRLAGPPQRTHRIACGGLFDDGPEPTRQLRIGLLHLLPPAAGLTYTSVGGGTQFSARLQLVQPLINGDPRHPGQLRQVADAASSQLPSLLCDEQTRLVFVQSSQNSHPGSLGRSSCLSPISSDVLHYIKHNL